MARSANIRCFRWDDLETWTGLFNEVNAFTDTDKALDLELARQMLSQPLCDPERNCLLAETGGAPAGFALVTPELPIGRAVASLVSRK